VRLLNRDDRMRSVKLLCENMDDLWHLHNLIEPEDLVYGVTYRTPEQAGDKLRQKKIEKVRMYLGLRVEWSEFQDFSDRLRIHGTIEDGPQDLGSHHTINVDASDPADLTIVKDRNEWRAHHFERIREAEDAAKRPLVVFVAMDDDDATIAVLRQYGVQHIATMESGRSGKQYGECRFDKKAYYGEIAAKVAQLKQRDAPVVIVGPGFAREEFVSFLKERMPQVAADCITEGIGQTGMTGVQEAMKRGIVERVQKGSRVSFETALVERFLTEIAKDAFAAYGPKEIRAAIEGGAVAVLLVTDVLVRKPETEQLMGAAGASGAEVHIISTHHEAGKKLEAIGGVGAILRYKFP